MIRMMINCSKNAVFHNHPRPHGVPLLRRMLPVLTQDLDSTVWFGGIDNAEAHSAGSAADLAGPAKRKAGPSTAGPVKKQKAA